MHPHHSHPLVLTVSYISWGNHCQRGQPVYHWRCCWQQSLAHTQWLSHCLSIEQGGWILPSTHTHSIQRSQCTSSTPLCLTSLVGILAHKHQVVFDAGRVTSWTLASTWTHNLFFWESVGRGWVKLVVGLVLFPEMVQACRHQQIWTFWLCLQTVYQPPITSLPSGFPDYETHIVLQHVFHQVRVGMGYHQHTLQRMRPYFRVHCWYQACSGATLSCPECSLLISTNSNAWMCCVTFVRIVTSFLPPEKVAASNSKKNFLGKHAPRLP